MPARLPWRGRPVDAGQSPEHPVASNLLERDFEAASPNVKWAADFTYVDTAEGWLYVAVVLDLFSRRSVGWSMSATMTAQLVMGAFVMAVWRRGKPKELLHHSDQGSQYAVSTIQGAAIQRSGKSARQSLSGSFQPSAPN